MSDSMWRIWARALEFLSAEWMLRDRPNGGTVILSRTLWIWCAFASVFLLLMDASSDDRVFAFELDVSRALDLIRDHNEALLLSFGGIYTALYARFASQWTYLASLYNQMMEVAVAGQNLCPERMARWKAGFVEDAYSLHLAQKPMFAEVVAHLLVDSAVRRHVVDSLTEDTVRELESKVRSTLTLLNRHVPSGRRPPDFE